MPWFTLSALFSNNPGGGSEETEADVGWAQPQLITVCLSFSFTSISAN